MARFAWLLAAATALFPTSAAQAPDAAEKARELLVAGKSAEAIAIYRELVNTDPGNTALRMNLCIALFKARRHGEAIGEAEAALRAAPDLPTANLFLGASYLELGDAARALEPLRKAVNALPKDRNARLMLAQAALALEHSAEAEEHYRVAADWMPGNAKAWYGLGQSLEALARIKIAELEKAAPDSAYHHAMLAESLARQRRYGSALRHYREALAKAPGLPGVHAGMAMLLRAAGDLAGAAVEEELERTLPPSVAAHGDASAEALYRASKAYQERAAEAYGKLAKLAPSAESHMHAAKTYESRNLYPEAAGEWRRAVELAPHDPRAQTGLAVALYHARDFTGALPLLERLSAARPASAELRFLYGASLLGIEQPEAAVPHLEEALKLDAQFLPARAALGQAYLRLGKAERAIAHLKASLETDEDGSRRFQLARAYQMAGQVEEAKRAMAEYEHFRKLAAQRAREEEEIW